MIGCCNPPGEKEKDCRATCYTPRACGTMADSLYPFSSQTEKEWLTKTKTTNPVFIREQKAAMKQVCNEYMDRDDTSTPPQWCQPHQEQKYSKETMETETHASTTMNLTLIPAGCSQLGSKGRSGPFDRTFLIPQGKLLFCGIPKVGITQWLRFSRFVFGAGDYQSIPHYKRDITPFQFDKLSRLRQEEVMSDPSWTKAIFLRDPAERLLSAYLNKVEKPRFGELQVDLPTTNMSFRVTVFHNWVQSLETTPIAECQGRKGPSWCWNPHWRPQVYSCGIRETLPSFDFVGSLSQAANHTKTLLELVNLWKDYGAKYMVSLKATPTKNSNSCRVLPPNPNDDDGSDTVLTVGFQQNIKAKNDRHTRDSKSKIDEFFTSEIWEIVKRLYKQDYELWNALNVVPPEENRSWTTGRQLAGRLNPSCQEAEEPTETL